MSLGGGFKVGDIIAFGAEGSSTGKEFELRNAQYLTPSGVARLDLVHRVSRVVLSALLLLTVAACRGNDGTSAAGTPIPDGWRVERDPDFSIAVPPDWRSKPGSSSIGTEFVNLLGPAEIDGYPQGW